MGVYCAKPNSGMEMLADIAASAVYFFLRSNCSKLEKGVL